MNEKYERRNLRRIMAKKNEIAKVDAATIQPVEQIESLIPTRSSFSDGDSYQYPYHARVQRDASFYWIARARCFISNE